MKRTSTNINPRSGAANAIQAAKAGKGFTKAPGAAKRKSRGGKAFKTTDLVEIGMEIFREDDFRDDTPDEAAKSIGLLKPQPADDLAAAIQTAKARVEAGDAPRYREQQGGVVLVNAKGHIQEWVLQPAHRTTGKLAGSNELRASKQFQRQAEATYEERARRRIEAIGKSLFQSTGGLTPDRLKALTEAYKKDRERRGWKVPDL